jgi:hypothetical protein
MLPINYFNQRIPGPEVLLEDAVSSYLPSLLDASCNFMWAAGSMSIGAGKPDLIIASFNPVVYNLRDIHIHNLYILACLREIGKANPKTIASKIGKTTDEILSASKPLIEKGIVINKSDNLFISKEWKNILPTIIAVEAKVSKWQEAVNQANRNRIFAHHSFIALPEKSAIRVQNHSVFHQFGIGILGVSEQGSVRLIRSAEHNTPKVWAYYYQIALQISKSYIQE